MVSSGLTNADANGTWRRILAYGVERLVCRDPPCIHASKRHDAIVNVAPENLKQFYGVPSVL